MGREEKGERRKERGERREEKGERRKKLWYGEFGICLDFGAWDLEFTEP